MTTDVTNVQNAFQMTLRIAVRAPLTFLCSIVMCFSINTRLSLIFLIAVVFLAIFLGIVVNVAKKRFSAVFEKYDALNSSVQENVSAIRVVKAFVREDYETDKFNKAVTNLYNMFLRAEKVVVLNSPVMMLTVYTCIIALSWLGAKYIVMPPSLELTLTTGQAESVKFSMKFLPFRTAMRLSLRSKTDRLTSIMSISPIRQAAPVNIR